MPEQTIVLCLAQQATGAARLAVREAETSGKERVIVDGGQPGVQLHYESDSNGDASLRFTSQKQSITLIDPLRGASIYEQSQGGKTRRYQCSNPNQTLSLNFTQALMQTLHKFR
ncbi:MAG: hypothetical protein U7M05_01475 [Candidatus Igneacidithiobacillus chanchocoensis]